MVNPAKPSAKPKSTTSKSAAPPIAKFTYNGITYQNPVPQPIPSSAQVGGSTSSQVEEVYQDQFASEFLPAVFKRVGGSTSPWSPDLVKIIQDTKDIIYPNIRQKIDEKSKLYRVVSVYFV